MRKRYLAVLLLPAFLLAGSLSGAKDKDGPVPLDTRFGPPQPVSIDGYEGHAMEPFLTRDGAYLFFNNRNAPEDQTDLHVARRVSDLRFSYLGKVEGANSGELDGVASADRAGRFYLVSTRDYAKSGNTLWAGDLAGTRVTNVRPLVTNFTPKKPLRLNIDLEISADGRTLYVAENKWDLFRREPATSDLAMARLGMGGFTRLPNSDQLMAAINTPALEFAPSTSPDELELYFTRLFPARLRKGQSDAFMIMMSTRANRSAAWGTPRHITAAAGHVEAPSLTRDGCGLYFHKLVNDRFSIYLTRRLCGKGVPK